MASERSSNSRTGGQSDECDGEDEEPSSSNQNKNETVETVEATLSNFRNLWQRELAVPQSDAENDSGKTHVIIETEEEKAKTLFLKGAEFERNGDMYEAIKYYKRSVQLMPDIERRIYQNAKLKSKTGEEITVAVQTEDKTKKSKGDRSVHNMLQKISKYIYKTGKICSCENDQKETHISALPEELITYILRWIVSNDLDMISLERFAAVCRGFYLFGRDPEIWRLACIKAWGINCGTYEAFGYSSWRQMFVERPRLQFNGCYISKTTYMRAGENSFQDQFYRPWHLIKYFRYLRFFPEGTVLMMTTADEPIVCIDRLKQRSSRVQGVLYGHYRLSGDKVVIIVGKPANNQNKSINSANSRFKNRRRENVQESTEDTYNIELNLKSNSNHTNFSLVWRNYTIIARNNINGNVISTDFEISKNKFPNFKFIQVNRFHAKSDFPLQ